MILCAAYMLLLLELLTYLEKLFVALVVRQGSSVIKPEWTVAEVAWTRQLIRESRWRFAGLMEDTPTMIPTLLILLILKVDYLHYYLGHLRLLKTHAPLIFDGDRS